MQVGRRVIRSFTIKKNDQERILEERKRAYEIDPKQKKNAYRENAEKIRACIKKYL